MQQARQTDTGTVRQMRILFLVYWGRACNRKAKVRTTCLQLICGLLYASYVHCGALHCTALYGIVPLLCLFQSFVFIATDCGERRRHWTRDPRGNFGGGAPRQRVSLDSTTLGASLLLSSNKKVNRLFPASVRLERAWRLATATPSHLRYDAQFDADSIHAACPVSISKCVRQHHTSAVSTCFRY